MSELLDSTRVKFHVRIFWALLGDRQKLNTARLGTNIHNSLPPLPALKRQLIRRGTIFFETADIILKYCLS